MKKRIVSLLLLSVLVLTSCGKNAVDLTDVKPQTESEQESEETTVSTEAQEQSEEVLPTSADDAINNTPVTIQIGMITFDDTKIEDYVENLKKENPDTEYSVYNDKYYNETIKESERMETLRLFKDNEYADSMMKELFTDDQFNGAFLNVEYNDNFSEFTFRVDKEKYESAGISVSFGPYIYAALLNDSYQAYNKVKPEDRHKGRVIIIDDATDEIILDSNDSKSE